MKMKKVHMLVVGLFQGKIDTTIYTFYTSTNELRQIQFVFEDYDEVYEISFFTTMKAAKNLKDKIERKL